MIGSRVLEAMRKKKMRGRRGTERRTGRPNDLEEDEDILVLEWKCPKDKDPETNSGSPKIRHIGVMSMETERRVSQHNDQRDLRSHSFSLTHLWTVKGPSAYGNIRPMR
jgi:hypothetical protein